MQLIVLAGLPGTGKSSIAEALAHELRIAVFAKDWLEAALKRSNLQGETGYAAYELLTTLAERQLALGQSVILDSVASPAAVRAAWCSLAEAAQARWRVIECICSDEQLHRERLLARQCNIPGWHELAWEEVERVRGYYVPWQEERLLLDAVNPLDENIALALAYVCQHHERTSL